MATKSKAGLPGLEGKEKSHHDVEFAKGGKTEMFGKGDRTITATTDAADEARPGVTGKDDEGSDGKYAEGGRTKMFGFTGALPAKGGITSAR